MKNLTKISSLLLGVGLAFASLPAFAAKSDRAEPGLRKAKAGAMLERRAKLRGHVAKRLDLSAEQTAQLKAQRTERHTAFKALRADPNLTRDQKRAKVRELAQSGRQEMRAVLTPEQQQKLERLRHRLHARLGARPHR